ncbi:MAG: branched-chain amino acid ABC transporter permease [Streptosporangiales bacterium]|nr:branched-chain amino acid ABC transporter permease [Streptosporangiales bacterium]
MDVLFQTLVYGFATGGVIAVAAVGLTLSFGVTGFINFGYGELLTVAAYTTYVLTEAGLGLLPAAAAGTAITSAVAVGVARTCYQPLASRGPLPLLITSIGVAFVLQNLVRIGFGGEPRGFPAPTWTPWQLGGVFIPKLQTVIFLVAGVCMLGVHLLLRHTLLGRTMRAAASNEDLARLSGLDTRRIVLVTWVASSLIAGLGGVLLGASQGDITPSVGFEFLLLVFAAALLGGIGQPYGAMLGALLIGLGVEFGAAYVSANYNYALAFGVIVLVLLARPGGLFGRGGGNAVPSEGGTP